MTPNEFYVLMFFIGALIGIAIQSHHWLKIQFKYASYIIRHKYFVFLECAKRWHFWRGITHDMSKLFTDEWAPYAEYFNGPELPSIHGVEGERRIMMLLSGSYKEKVQHEFDRAWLRHIHRNSHHPQHHILREDDGGMKILPMPHADRVEMLCDWIGAGRAQGFGNNTAVWYTKNRDNIKLNEITRNWVEEQLFGEELG